MPALGMRDFTRRLFQHCPMLVSFEGKVEEYIKGFSQYKMGVPVYGCIILDPSLSHCLLVKVGHLHVHASAHTRMHVRVAPIFIIPAWKHSECYQPLHECPCLAAEVYLEISREENRENTDSILYGRRYSPSLISIATPLHSHSTVWLRPGQKMILVCVCEHDGG